MTIPIIDDVEHSVDSLSEDEKAKLISLQFVDRKLAQTNPKILILKQTVAAIKSVFASFSKSWRQ
jgi:hypothetical protein